MELFFAIDSSMSFENITFRAPTAMFDRYEWHGRRIEVREVGTTAILLILMCSLLMENGSRESDVLRPNREWTIADQRIETSQSKTKDISLDTPGLLGAVV